MDHKIRNLMASTGCLAIILLVSAISVFAAQTAPDEASNLEAGLKLLPPDLKTRWESLKAEADVSQVGEYLNEGEQVLSQLGRMSASVGGQIPEPGSASYTVYTGVLNDLIKLLDKIELAVILKMPGDEQLEKLLADYQGEKDQLASNVREDRQKLIELGSKSIEEQLRDPYFRKYPHRRAVVADIYFRLAELTYQETREKFLDEQDRYISSLNELSKTDPKAAATLKPPKPNYKKVLSLYQNIIDEFPDTPYGVDALYNIAVLTAESDNPNDKATANQYFETLVEIYPGNKYTLNALQRIGEYYFMPPVNNLNKAIQINQRIAKEYGSTEYYTDALYMLGWCYYRMSGDFPTAVEYFAKALDTGFNEDGTRRKTTSVRNIAPEAMKYISIAFSVDPREWEGAGVDNFVTWLQARPDRLRNYGTDLLIAQGDIFRNELGRYEDAVKAYTQFMTMFPLEPRAPIVQLSIMNIYRSGQIYDLARAHGETVKFFDLYNPDTQWWQTNGDPVVRAKVIPLLEAFLDTLVNEELVMGVDASDLSHYQAYELYSRQYMRFWPKGPNAYRIHYYLASVLENNLKRPMDALREYWQVATAYNDTDFKENASQRIVAITRDFVKQERAGEIYISEKAEVLPPSAKPLDPPADPLAAAPDSAGSDTAATKELKVNRTPLLHSEELMLAGMDNYITSFTASPLTPTMLYQAGSTLFEHDWIPESRPFLENLIAGYPDHKTIEDAYKLLLEGYYKSKDLAGVEAIAVRIASANVSDELKQAAYTRKSVSIFNHAASLVGASDHLGAAAEFMRVASETPNSEQAPRSLFIAGGEYAAGQEFVKSNDAYLQLVDRYPQTEWAPKALNNVGFNLMNQIKNMAQAAVTFERLANAYPQSELIQLALGNASFCYNQVKDHPSAIRVNELYIAKYPAAEDASSYLFENANHYLGLNDIVKANEIYRRFAERFPDDPRTVQAHYERGKYALDQGNRTDAAKEFTATVDAHSALLSNGKTGSPKYAALALGQLLMWEKDDYDKLAFTLPADKMAAAKKRKLEWRDALIVKYRKLISLGQKEGYQAFYTIGALVDNQTQVTFNQEMPSIPDLQKRLDATDVIVAEAIGLNVSTVENYRVGNQQLLLIKTQLDSLVTDRGRQYQEYSNLVDRLQIDSTAVGVADSLAKLNNMKRLLSEADSARVEAGRWAAACADRIPEVASRDGDYMSKLWREQVTFRAPEKNEYARIMVREGWLNNVAAPVAPEVAGLYLQAVVTTINSPAANKDQWIRVLESKFAAVSDTIMAQFVDQVNLERSRVDRYESQFANMLPKGEDAKSPEGLYLDEMNDAILENIDYLNTFCLDLIKAHSAILDTMANYPLPPEFADATKSRVLDFILDQYRQFEKYGQDANQRKEDFARKYEETQELQWDDASVGAEEITANFRDDGLNLLQEGFTVKQQYQLAGMAGIEILRLLVTLKPDEYASIVGIQPESHVLISGTDWLVWPRFVENFSSPQVDDSEWEHATAGSYPSIYNLGTIDSLGAQPIWYFRPPPPKGPEWANVPKEVVGYEGQPLEISVVGTGPEVARLQIKFQSANLPQAASFTDRLDGTGTLSWLPTYDDAGDYSASLVLTDGEFSVAAEVPIKIENMKRAMGWTKIPGTIFAEEGSLVEFVVAGDDPEKVGSLKVNYTTPNLPDAAEFNDNGDGSGAFSWQTTFTDSGAYTAAFALTNGDTTVMLEVPVTIGNVNHPPVWVQKPDPSLTAKAGELVEFALKGEDQDGDKLTLSYSSDNLPATAVFNDNGDGSATFSWQPKEGEEGIFKATFTLSDGALVEPAEVEIAVGAANRPPRWVETPPAVSGPTGQLIEFAVKGDDPEGAPVTIAYDSPNLPATATFTDNGDGSGLFSWQPAEGDVGSYTATFSISDAQLTATADVAITVGAANQAPVWVEMPGSVSGSTSETIQFIVAGRDPEGAAMTIGYSSPNLPAAAQFQDNGDGTGKFVWQPGEGEAGSYVATLTLSDEELSSSAEVAISVGSANKPPVWIDIPSPVSGTTGSAMEFTIRGEDPESGALTIGFSSPNLPAAVQFKDNGDGSGAFTWTPGDGDADSYTALFTLSDGSLTATSEVALMVTKANQPPVWSLIPEKVAVDAGQAVEFSVTGEDPDGQSLKITYSSADLPQGVEFTDHGDGSATLKWQTEPASAGSYKADFTITDGALNAAATVEIEVRAVEAPPAEGGTPPGEETKPPEGGEPTQPE